MAKQPWWYLNSLKEKIHDFFWPRPEEFYTTVRKCFWPTCLCLLGVVEQEALMLRIPYRIFDTRLDVHPHGNPGFMLNNILTTNPGCSRCQVVNNESAPWHLTMPHSAFKLLLTSTLSYADSRYSLTQPEIYVVFAQAQLPVTGPGPLALQTEPTLMQCPTQWSTCDLTSLVQCIVRVFLNLVLARAKSKFFGTSPSFMWATMADNVWESELLTCPAATSVYLVSLISATASTQPTQI